jgi:hypothetical protein
VGMYICGDVCMQVGLCMSVGTYVCMWGCFYVCGGVCMCVGMYIYMCVGVYVSLWGVCISVCGSV